MFSSEYCQVSEPLNIAVPGTQRVSHLNNIEAARMAALPVCAKTHFIIGSRKSELALWQARAVKLLLEKGFPHKTFEIKTELTVGDNVLDVHLATLASAAPGLFTKELETGLLVRVIHSCPSVVGC